MIKKIMSLVWQASPFVPKGSLPGHIPETLSQRRNMNKRTYEIKVRLTAEEMAHLNRLVVASRLSRETYLRKLISGVVPKEAPPPDFWAMMREIHAIGNNMNQIAIPNPEENWAVFKNVHDPIIEREVWEQVQQRIGKTKRRPPKAENGPKHLLADYLYCADCGCKLHWKISSQSRKRKLTS